MKIVFNILIVLVVLGVLWHALSKESVSPDVTVAQCAASVNFKGARCIKSCVKYFSKPYSVTLDGDNDHLYVSNIATLPDTKDGQGYVCRTSQHGEILDTLNITGLNAPKGMTVLDNFLYITDINRLIKYDIVNDSVNKIYTLDNALFLIDVEHDRMGNIFISDSHRGCIYKLSKDSLKVFCNDSLCSNITGLCMDGNKLVAGARNRILQFDENGKVNVFSSEKFSIHGIKSDFNGNYIVSDFNGNVYAVSGKESQVLLKKRPEINIADFDYQADQKILFVPTYANNSLEIYELGSYLQQ